MTRLLLAAVLIACLAACEPEYAETAGESAEHPEVVGPADPEAISGGASADGPVERCPLPNSDR